MATVDLSHLHVVPSHPTLHTYGSDVDEQDDVLSDGFWNAAASQLAVGDLIACQLADSQPQTFRPHLNVTGSDGGVVTVALVP